MVLRILLAGFAAILGTSAASSQTPTPAPAASTISAEATDTLRAAPDVARITLHVVTKDPVAETATDENEKLVKDLLSTIAKLKIAGAKVSAQSLKIGKIDSEGQPGMPNNNPMPKTDYRSVRAITITVKGADADQLQIDVAKIQKEAAKLGITGDSNNNVFNGFGNEKQNVVKVSYGLQNGWDDRSKDVLSKLTKRALERATLLAEGAGLKVVEVLSIDEPRDPTTPAAALNLIYGAAEQTDDLTDGELVQKVRVRVTVRVSK